jgi:hypothetical protein
MANEKTLLEFFGKIENDVNGVIARPWWTWSRV